MWLSSYPLNTNKYKLEERSRPVVFGLFLYRSLFIPPNTGVGNINYLFYLGNLRNFFDKPHLSSSWSLWKVIMLINLSD